VRLGWTKQKQTQSLLFFLLLSFVAANLTCVFMTSSHPREKGFTSPLSPKESLSFPCLS
jgi:hypothetical protein